MQNNKKKKPSAKPTFAQLVVELEKRCKDSRLPIQQDVDKRGDNYVRVELPNGREKRALIFSRSERLKCFLSTSFEKYVFLGDYIAVASYEDQYIEAILEVRSTGPIGSVESVFRNFEVEDSNDTNQPIKIEDQEFAPGCEILIGKCSDDIYILTSNARRSIMRQRLNRHHWSIQIKGVKISTHDGAVSLLERLTNSLFFQIDLDRNRALCLKRERRPFRRLSFRGHETTQFELQFPRTEFDDSPITLYWYARSARGMPLLQFLAYYQCVEFYYPIYSQSEACRRVKNILKDPKFRIDRDTDLTKVVSAISRSTHGFSDERSMLRATIRECISDTDMREYLISTEERRDFFSAKTKGLTDHKIPIGNVNADLRDDVSDRIYDLRCKIVHTKTGTGNDSVDLLLPYSKGEELIDNDIALLKFVAQKVLIAGSSEFKIQ